MSTRAQVRANRKNSKKSTGPRTTSGKAAVAGNACRHGLSGAFTILAHEDRAEFQALLDKYRAEFKVTTEDETFLVETMVQSRWTLARARRIEGHLLDQLSGQPIEDDPNARIAAQIAAKSGAALATVQRYATAAERSYFRARRELQQARSRELRNKADAAQLWLKAEMQRPLYPAAPSECTSDPSLYVPAPRPSAPFSRPDGTSSHRE